jgi:hypothetical protein
MLEATAKTPFEQELGYVMAMPCAFWLMQPHTACSDCKSSAWSLIATLMGHWRPPSRPHIVIEGFSTYKTARAKL